MSIASNIYSIGIAAYYIPYSLAVTPLHPADQTRHFTLDQRALNLQRLPNHFFEIPRHIMSNNASGNRPHSNRAEPTINTLSSNKTLNLNKNTLSSIDLVIRGQQWAIERVSALPTITYDPITLTKILKEKLIDYAQAESSKVGSAFYQQDLQIMVNQLAEQSRQCLATQEKQSQPSLNSSADKKTQAIEEKALQRQKSTASISSPDPIKKMPGRPISDYIDTYKSLFISTENTQSSKLSNCKSDEYLQSSIENHQDPTKDNPFKIYNTNYYQAKETITQAIPLGQYSLEPDWKDKIITADYNNFKTQQIRPLYERKFFHQKQVGPFCHAVSINNFIGDKLLNPNSLINKFNIRTAIDHPNIRTMEALKVISKIRLEQIELDKELKNFKNCSLEKDIIKEDKISRTLIKELNCRYCKITQGNNKKIQKFLQAAEAVNIERLLFSFSYKKAESENCQGHSIALKRDPDFPKLWIVLDGNLPPYRVTLQEALENYTKHGDLQIIAREDLFKKDSQIPHYKN